jgi:sarcosine oxidase gamma subunit|tara:strand:+ start:4393 stop:4917 length:525 start_codon:yes stop_codon:yes gene_type:complete
MRDDSHRWDASISADMSADMSIVKDGLSIAAVALNRQTLISGPAVLTQVEDQVVEWPGVAASAAYTLCLRRDRVLVVNGPDVADGWDVEEQLAISDVSDAYRAFDLEGPHAMEVLNRGAELSLTVPSRSVARMLFGLGVLLYRVGAKNRFRIHVASAQADALWKSLQTAARAVG